MIYVLPKIGESRSLSRCPRLCLRVLLVCVCLTCLAALAQAQSNPTLYIRWRPLADAYDTLTVTVNLQVDPTTPNGVYSIRAEQTTNSANYADHSFSVTNGVPSVASFNVFNSPLLGSGPTGIILWVNDEPTNQFATVRQTYHYTDGGNEPDYYGRHNNPQMNFTDSITFRLDSSALNDFPQGIQPVPEPGTWGVGALLTAAAVLNMARRRSPKESSGTLSS